MDCLTFFSKLIESLAWPAVVIIVFFALKDKLTDLIPFLKKLKIQGIEAEFAAGIREVSEELVDSPIFQDEKIQQKSNTESQREQLIRMAENAPRAAVLEAWLLVEHAAINLIEYKNVADRSLRMVGPTIIRNYLDKTEAITSTQRDSFSKLRALRNKVVHLADINLPLEDVISYVDLALSLSAQFKLAAQDS